MFRSDWLLFGDECLQLVHYDPPLWKIERERRNEIVDSTHNAAVWEQQTTMFQQRGSYSGVNACFEISGTNYVIDS